MPESHSMPTDPTPDNLGLSLFFYVARMGEISADEHRANGCRVIYGCGFQIWQ
jgi:hypothetical protein